MSQFSALKLLEEKAKTARPWVCVDEVAKELDLSKQAAYRSLSKLHQYGEARVRFDPASGKRQYRHFSKDGI